MITMISFLLLSFCMAFAIVFYFWFKTFFKFRNENFPSPPSYFLVGHVPYLNSNDKVLPYLHRHLVEHKNFLKLYIGLKPLLVTSDYDFFKWILNSEHITKTDEYKYIKPWLGEGLLLATGQHWKSQRKILTPAFHFKMIENHISALRNTTSVLIKKFQENLEKSIDVYPFMSLFALDAVCESTMATSINAQETNSDYTKSVKNISRILYERTFNVLKMYDFLFKFQKDYKVFNDAVESINTFTTSVIRKRRDELKIEDRDKGEKDADNIYERKKTPFIDILLNAKDENNESLSDQDILEEVNTIIFAGRTTGSAIGFALYNLAQHPKIQRRAFEEQKLLFGSDKNPFLTYADLNNMKYLEMTIKETLRLYPAVPMIGRKIEEDTYYDGKLLPKGLSVVLSIYTLHRNPNLFENPDKFDPDRFENEFKLTYSYLPFSAGQRNCIGQKFAMIEMKQVISAVLRNFELIPVPNHDLNLIAEISLKSSNGLFIIFRKR